MNVIDAPTPQSAAITRLNDAFRKTFSGGKIVLTPGFRAQSLVFKAKALNAVRAYDKFNSSNNDPYHEHDFGAFEVDGESVYFKIDYYDKSLDFGSDDPADPASTTRVLTIMLAEEY